MKKVRIRFCADLLIEADSIKEARKKWEGMQLFSQEAKDCHAEYIDTDAIEDAETFKDISDEWDADDDNEDERTLLDDALDYVREQLDEDELMIYKATVSKNLNHRMPASMGLDDGKIIDLLEEYGEDNDLPEGWWEEYGDIDDIMMKL